VCLGVWPAAAQCLDCLLRRCLERCILQLLQAAPLPGQPAWAAAAPSCCSGGDTSTWSCTASAASTTWTGSAATAAATSPAVNIVIRLHGPAATRQQRRRSRHDTHAIPWLVQLDAPTETTTSATPSSIVPPSSSSSLLLQGCCRCDCSARRRRDLPCDKRLFSSVSLCLSQACRGKWIVCTSKWLQKGVPRTDSKPVKWNSTPSTISINGHPSHPACPHWQRCCSCAAYALIITPAAACVSVGVIGLRLITVGCDLQQQADGIARCKTDRTAGLPLAVLTIVPVACTEMTFNMFACCHEINMCFCCQKLRGVMFE
jgi:hypothetical protein